MHDPLLDKIISTDELAEILDLTPRRIRQLAFDRIIPQVSRGRFKLGPAVQGYLLFVAFGEVLSAGGARAEMLMHLQEHGGLK